MNEDKIELEGFNLARQLLEEYSKAKLVVTSRIHVALPCLALNTPVIFIHHDLSDSRFHGLINLFNHISLKDLIRRDFQIPIEHFMENPNDVGEIAAILRKKCSDFINESNNRNPKDSNLKSNMIEDKLKNQNSPIYQTQVYLEHLFNVKKQWMVEYACKATEQAEWLLNRNKELEKGKIWLEEELKNREKLSKERLHWINDLKDALKNSIKEKEAAQAWNKELEKGKIWLEEELKNREKLSKERLHWINDLKDALKNSIKEKEAAQAWNKELEDGKTWLEQELKNSKELSKKQLNWINNLKNTLKNSIKEKEEAQAWNKELEDGKTWLEQELKNSKKLSKERLHWINDLKDALKNSIKEKEAVQTWNKKLEDGKIWLEKELKNSEKLSTEQLNWTNELKEALKKSIKEKETIQAWNKELEGDRIWLEQELKNSEESLKNKQKIIEGFILEKSELVSIIGQGNLKISLLEKENSSLQDSLESFRKSILGKLFFLIANLTK